MRKRLTPATLAMKKPETGRVEVRDTDSPLVFRVTATGARSLTVRTRLRGEQIRLTYSRPVLAENLGDARTWASEVIEKCRKGVDPRNEDRRLALEAKKKDRLRFESVVEDFMKRHGSKNRTADETQRIFDKYALPQWGDRQIHEVTRSDVNELLDKIEDGNLRSPDGEMLGGPVMADRTLAAVRKLFNWYAVRDDKFVSPIVRGMARTKPREHARTRVLSDEEIAAMWPILDGLGTFGGIVKALFLTAQRRGEVADMRRSEIDAEGVWAIPAHRYKTKTPMFVPLSDPARAVIDGQDVIDGSDLVFTTTGKSPFSGFSKSKANLDALVLAALRQRAEKQGEDPEKVELSDWRIHDIRRTAKTLMVRAGVRPDISERVLGHVIPGVEGVYDRHSYLEEKRDALERLAVMIDRIANPPAEGADASNVVELKR